MAHVCFCFMKYSVWENTLTVGAGTQLVHAYQNIQLLLEQNYCVYC